MPAHIIVGEIKLLDTILKSKELITFFAHFFVDFKPFVIKATMFCFDVVCFLLI